MAAFPKDPTDMLRIAEQLAEQARKESNELKFRAAIGRAYYALFLLSREIVGWYDRQEIHSQVIHQLSQKTRDRMVGEKLKSLKELREIADYQFQSVSPEHQDWEENWSTAMIYVEHLLNKFRKERWIGQDIQYIFTYNQPQPIPPQTNPP